MRYFNKMITQGVLLTISILLLLPAVTMAQTQYTITDLGTFEGCNDSDAYAINNLGQVVGSSCGAFLWQNGTMINLGGGPSITAYAINNA
jgi:probable HAF family extracellular repeat protein